MVLGACEADTACARLVFQSLLFILNKVCSSSNPAGDSRVRVCFRVVSAGGLRGWGLSTSYCLQRRRCRAHELFYTLLLLL